MVIFDYIACTRTQYLLVNVRYYGIFHFVIRVRFTHYYLICRLHSQGCTLFYCLSEPTLGLPCNTQIRVFVPKSFSSTFSQILLTCAPFESNGYCTTLDEALSLYVQYFLITCVYSVCLFKTKISRSLKIGLDFVALFNAESAVTSTFLSAKLLREIRSVLLLPTSTNITDKYYRFMCCVRHYL